MPRQNRKLLKILLTASCAVIATAQFVRPDLSNPPVVETELLEATAAVPTNVASILQRSCNDCHTSRSVFPWYSQISPVSWWLKSHIDEARAELNFSEWGTYTERKRWRKLDAVCDEVTRREMPLPSYTWMHRDAVLSGAEIRLICDWAAGEKAKLGGASK